MIPKYGRIISASNHLVEYDVSNVFDEEMKICSKRYGKPFVLGYMSEPRAVSEEKVEINVGAGKVFTNFAASSTDGAIERSRIKIAEACR